MKTREQSRGFANLKNGAVESLFREWDAVSESASILESPLILPNYYLRIGRETNVDSIIETLVGYLEKKGDLLTFYGNCKSYVAYLAYSMPEDPRFESLSKFHREYDQKLCRFGKPYQGVLCIDVSEWVARRACREEKFQCFLSYMQTIDEDTLTIFISSVHDPRMNLDAMDAISSRTRVREIVVDSLDADEAYSYLKGFLEQSGFILEPGAEAILSETAAYIASLGEANGYRSLREFGSDVIYSLLLGGKKDKTIKEDDVVGFRKDGDLARSYSLRKQKGPFGLI